MTTGPLNAVFFFILTYRYKWRDSNRINQLKHSIYRKPVGTCQHDMALLQFADEEKASANGG